MTSLRIPRTPLYAPTPEQQHRARLWCASRALTTDDPHQAAREALQALGLLDDPDRLLRDPMHSHKLAPGQRRTP